MPRSAYTRTLEPLETQEDWQEALGISGALFITADSTSTLTNKTFDANGTGNALSNVEVADLAASAVVTEGEGISSSDNDTSLPTSAAVKDYVDTEISGISTTAAASQAEMETGTATNVYASPGRQQFHKGHPKCAAVVTVSGGTPTLDATDSYNITSITDGGTGDLVITIATDFANATWVCVTSIMADVDDGSSVGSSSTGFVAITSGDLAEGSVTLGCWEPGSTTGGEPVDPVQWHMIGIGDQA
jgi:hypothetical protein